MLTSFNDNPIFINSYSRELNRKHNTEDILGNVITLTQVMMEAQVKNYILQWIS